MLTCGRFAGAISFALHYLPEARTNVGSAAWRKQGLKLNEYELAGAESVACKDEAELLLLLGLDYIP